jgi:hypothetical protein
MAGTGRRRLVTVAIAAGLLIFGRPAVANSTEQITIVLLVVDQAGVDPDVMMRAKWAARRVYDGIGIRLVWVGSTRDAYRFVVNIIAGTIGTDVSGKKMGLAPGQRERRGKLAYALYGRIQDLALTTGTDPGILLGHVIAHEIGHLLLPYDSHAESGLMRAGWDTQQALRARTGSLTFTSQEAVLMREAAERSTSVTSR